VFQEKSGDTLGIGEPTVPVSGRSLVRTAWSVLTAPKHHALSNEIVFSEFAWTPARIRSLRILVICSFRSSRQRLYCSALVGSGFHSLQPKSNQSRFRS